MYSEVFASVSAAGATGLCSVALTGCVAACYGHGKRSAGRLLVRQHVHWQVSRSPGTNSILACAVRLTYENSKCTVTQLPNLTVQKPLECATMECHPCQKAYIHIIL